MIAGKTLFISPLDETAICGGRDMMSAMTLAVLGNLLGDRLLHFRLPQTEARALPALLRGHVDGVNSKSVDAIDNLVREQGVTRLFLDGSNLGGLASALRRRHPQLRIISFCHNVETRFFLGAFRARPAPRAAAVLIANHWAERRAVRASDTILCLSARDSEMLRRIHGRAADAILPLAIADSYAPDGTPPPARTGRHVLFVGGGFYANRDGLSWYLRDIAPKAGVETIIVGRGLDDLAEPCRRLSHVNLVGAVDDLAPYYRAAHVVVAPIRDGSGMKTKVAEALMHGKTVLGTAEAFSGYGEAVIAANRLCDDTGEFVAALRQMIALYRPAFDPAMRALYEGFHSFAAARERMAAALSITAR